MSAFKWSLLATPNVLSRVQSSHKDRIGTRFDVISDCIANACPQQFYLTRVPVCWTGEEGEEGHKIQVPWKSPVVAVSPGQNLVVLTVFPSSNCEHPTYKPTPMTHWVPISILNIDTWGIFKTSKQLLSIVNFNNKAWFLSQYHHNDFLQRSS
jgi:hypothetical protein